MSTDVIQNSNQLIERTAPLVGFLDEVNLAELRGNVTVDWRSNLVIRCDQRLKDLLLAQRLVHLTADNEISFDAKGKAFLGKLLLGLDEFLRDAKTIGDRYLLLDLLAAGKNSLAYKAKDLKLGTDLVLKFFRPGRGENIIKNIAKLGAVGGSPFLIKPIDIFRHEIDTGHSGSITIDVLVFPFIEGITFREYIARERNSSPILITSFIEQTCIALMALQKEGLDHGDLHPNNVLVTTESDGNAAFRIIDVSYGTDAPSDYEYPSNDMDGFKFILQLVLEDLQLRLSRMSLRRFLGAKTYSLVKYILETKGVTFSDIHKELKGGEQFTAYRQRQRDFLSDKFRAPRDFGILRYEELSNPNLAMKLFHPYPLLFERLCAFGSAILFGHRGTGKSTYMAAMNFAPEVSEPPVNYKESFGILFSCRQGEFRKFSGRNLRITSEVKARIKHILITKIIRKTLQSLATGVSQDRLRPPESVRALSDMLLPHFVKNADGLMTAHQYSEIESLRATVLVSEINAIDELFMDDEKPLQSALLDEHSLVQFFEAVRVSFSDLNQVRFLVLFDDAGRPNVPREVQISICDMMASSNSIYCVKLSAEKQTFDFVTTEKKALERVHDVEVFTISDFFNMGSGLSKNRTVIEGYFKALISKRLRVFNYRSFDITDYLGQEAIKTSELIRRLASSSRNGERPVYGGWDNVWQISDRTLRHLVEMISVIFDEADITSSSAPQVVDNRIQNRQILRFSQDKLRALMYLPGTIEINNKKQPLGKMLYEFAGTFGKVSQFYLKRSGKNKRFDERLAIEVDNTLNLNAEAKRVLDELIRFAVIDDEKFAVTLDDKAQKPIYTFNRVYCPALKMSFRRADHWRLSSCRFEKLLLTPSTFMQNDKQLNKLLNVQPDLFDEK